MHKLYNMKLLEFFSENNHTGFLRVPGGWVYGDLAGCCFIPFDNEFQNTNSGVAYEKH